MGRAAAGHLVEGVSIKELARPSGPARNTVPRAARLLEPDLEAWVYLYNRDVGEAPVIASGDWRAYRAQRQPRPSLALVGRKRRSPPKRAASQVVMGEPPPTG